MQIAQQGDTIQVIGTCPDTAVTVTVDDFTIEGVENAILDGGGSSVITVSSARRVTIRDLTVRNGSNGIVAKRGAILTIRDVVAEDNAAQGIHIDDASTAEITDSTVLRSDVGILVTRSNATFNGTITSDQSRRGIVFLGGSNGLVTAGATLTTDNNGDGGLDVFGSSSLAVFGASIISTGNSEVGISVQGTSYLVVGSGSTVLAEGNKYGLALGSWSNVLIQGSSLTARDNLIHGVQIFGSIFDVGGSSTATASGNGENGFFVFESSHLNAGGTILTENNGGSGVELLSSSHLNARPDTELQILNNSIGLFVHQMSRANLHQGTKVIEANRNEGLFVTANSLVEANNIKIVGNAGPGMEVDNSTIDISRSTISGNGGPDVTGSFGAHLILNGNTIGKLPISCDGTVLSRGDAVCP